MSFTAKFRINTNRVLVEIPEKNLFLEKPNIVFFDSKNNGILGIGEPEEIIRSDVLKREKDFPRHLLFGKSFQYDDEKSGFFDLMVVEYYLADLYYVKQISPISFEPVDFDFQIENYEKWAEQRRLRFEYLLQAKQKGRTLKINGNSKGVPIEKKRVEKILRLILMSVLPLATLYFGFENSNSIIGLVFAFVGFFVSILIGIIAWALVSKVLLPKQYLAFILPELPFHSWTQKIARRLLNIEWQE